MTIHQNTRIARGGTPLAEAEGALILVHGRGATAESIFPMANQFHADRFAIMAPQAAMNSWYPHSFLAPMENNQPGLDSGLQKLADLVAEIEAAGMPAEKIVLGGFSQGACLASEYVARNAKRYGGLFVFSGGLIGPPGTPRSYPGSLAGTPIFLGCSDVDFHIPVERVHESAEVLEKLGGSVTMQIYTGMGHTVVQDEIEQVNRIIFQ